MCFEGPLGNVLRKSWEHPKSTSQRRPLKVILRSSLDVILQHPEDVISVCQIETMVKQNPQGTIWGGWTRTSSGKPEDHYLPAGNSYSAVVLQVPDCGLRYFCEKREYPKKGALKQKIEASLYTLYWGFKEIPFTLCSSVLAMILHNGAKFMQKLAPAFKNHMTNLDNFRRAVKNPKN